MGRLIPGIRPGEPTKNYIEWVMNRLTFCGAIAVCLISVLPDFFRAEFNVDFYFRRYGAVNRRRRGPGYGQPDPGAFAGAQL